MKKRFLFFLYLLVLCVFQVAHSKPLVVTTTSDLEELVKVIVEDKMEIKSLAKGTQDPHFLEAKPSYMLAVSKADLVVAVGLGLEAGWLPNIIKGARNPKVQLNKKGYIEVGYWVDRLEIANSHSNHAHRDVHSDGNPHIFLDPLRMLQISEKLKNELVKLTPENEALFNQNQNKFKKEIEENLKTWKKTLSEIKYKNIITYHQSFSYFFDRFGLKSVGQLEPKPGLPPTANHMAKLLNIAKNESVNLILIENYFIPVSANKLASQMKNVRVAVVPISIGGSEKIKSFIDLYSNLVSQFK